MARPNLSAGACGQSADLFQFTTATPKILLDFSGHGTLLRGRARPVVPLRPQILPKVPPPALRPSTRFMTPPPAP
jgi:hypothetical protein